MRDERIFLYLFDFKFIYKHFYILNLLFYILHSTHFTFQKYLFTLDTQYNTMLCQSVTKSRILCNAALHITAFSFGIIGTVDVEKAKHIAVPQPQSRPKAHHARGTHDIRRHVFTGDVDEADFFHIIQKII